IVALALLYRFGPACPDRSWRWLSWGSVLAVLGWAALSAAFSAYVARFGHFDRVYGPLGAGVGFMVWGYLSRHLVLLGAALNAEIEQPPVRPSESRDPEERNAFR